MRYDTRSSRGGGGGGGIGCGVGGASAGYEHEDGQSRGGDHTHSLDHPYGPLFPPPADSISPGEEYDASDELASRESAEANVDRSVAKRFGEVFYLGKVDGFVHREDREPAHFLNTVLWQDDTSS